MRNLLDAVAVIIFLVVRFPSVKNSPGTSAPTSLMSCGVRCKTDDSTSRIVGGQPATPHSWPWQCRLEGDIGNGYMIVCGASVLSTGYVLTAGHCVYNEDQNYAPIPTRNYSVVCGDYNRQNFETSRQTVGVAGIVVNARFQPTLAFLGNDVAIFQLASPLVFNDHVQPVCLPSKEVPVDTKCTVTGWGTIDKPGPDGTSSDILRQVTIPIVSQATCNSDYSPTIMITASMLCAGNQLSGGQDACSGDSGGPLVCPVDGRYELHGVVSFGRGCGQAGAVGVYTRVTSFVDWIRAHSSGSLVNGAFTQADPTAVCPHGLYSRVPAMNENCPAFYRLISLSLFGFLLFIRSK